MSQLTKEQQDLWRSKAEKFVGYLLSFTLVLALVGCGGGSNSSSSAGNTTGNVAGQWSAVGTSTQGNGTTNVYVNLTQQSNTSFFATASNIAVCPNNNVSQCLTAITGQQFSLNGTLNGNQVQMTVTSPNGNVTLNGTMSGQTMSGTYTAPGDAGHWTAQVSGPLTGTYTGTINSTPSPIPGGVSVSASVTQGQNYALTGAASFTSSPCFASLNFGQGSTAIGAASYLVDSTQGVQIGALPTGGGSFTVAYQVTAGACAGDFGTGTLTKQ